MVITRRDWSAQNAWVTFGEYRWVSFGKRRRLGPVFEQWEADFGPTFVLGSDPRKHKLRDDASRAFAMGKKYFIDAANITARELYQYVQSLATQLGWEFGGSIAGHLIGQFPHEKIAGDKVTLYVHPDSHTRMRALDENGRIRHWILEIHLVDRKQQIGAFYEELLTSDDRSLSAAL